MIEKHYTIAELAKLMHMSFERMRQLVMNEPGVIRLTHPTDDGRPARRTMYRVPESVVERILRRNANPPLSQFPA